jgi:hypothetical protein
MSKSAQPPNANTINQTTIEDVALGASAGTRLALLSGGIASRQEFDQTGGDLSRVRLVPMACGQPPYQAIERRQSGFLRQVG